MAFISVIFNKFTTILYNTVYREKNKLLQHRRIHFVSGAGKSNRLSFEKQYFLIVMYKSPSIGCLFFILRRFYPCNIAPEKKRKKKKMVNKSRCNSCQFRIKQMHSALKIFSKYNSNLVFFSIYGFTSVYSSIFFYFRTSS